MNVKSVAVGTTVNPSPPAQIRTCRLPAPNVLEQIWCGKTACSIGRAGTGNVAWLEYGGTRKRKGESPENTNLNLNRARQSSTLLFSSPRPPTPPGIHTTLRTNPHSKTAYMDPPDVTKEPLFRRSMDQMRTYIRPCDGVTACTPGPDGTRAP
jgi:hypothetical protein